MNKNYYQKGNLRFQDCNYFSGITEYTYKGRNYVFGLKKGIIYNNKNVSIIFVFALVFLFIILI